MRPPSISRLLTRSRSVLIARISGEMYCIQGQLASRSSNVGARNRRRVIAPTIANKGGERYHVKGFAFENGNSVSGDAQSKCKYMAAADCDADKAKAKASEVSTKQLQR